MFDVGFAELVLLALVGLLVLGPERLPGVARTIGGLTRKARSSWLNLKRSIEAEIRAEELKQPIKKFQDEVRQTSDKVNAGMDSLKNRAAAGAAAFTATPASSSRSSPPGSDKPASTESEDQQANSGTSAESGAEAETEADSPSPTADKVP